MKIRINNFITWRKSFFVFGIFLIFTAIFLPVDYLVNNAISPQIAQEIKNQGIPGRMLALQNQFRLGLLFLRIASVLLGGWLLVLARFWNYLKKWSFETLIKKRKADYFDSDSIDLRKEIIFPGICFILVIIISVPILYKGFDHCELTNYLMLAKRGPLVSMACQNMESRAGHPGFTVVESIFVKILGGSEATARLPALIFGAFVMFPVYFIARKYGPISFANLVCLGLAANGFYLFYNTYARGYAFALAAYMFCVAIVLSIRLHPNWNKWVWLGVFTIIACYSHQGSALYLSCLIFFLLIERYKMGGMKFLVQPAITLGTVILILFFLYSVAIPSDLKYLKEFSVTNYYQSYHINPRLLKVMVESWSWLRGMVFVGWIQFSLSTIGMVWLLRRRFWTTIYLVGPAVIGITIIWSRELYVFTRYFLHFLPVYVLLSVFPLWRIPTNILKINRRVAEISLGLLLVIFMTISLYRIYAMERCGVRAAVSDARKLMSANDRVMAILDGYITVRYYYPEVVNGYRHTNFWKEINSEQPPEFIINVPYVEFDIPGGTTAILKKYNLVKKYPSWLDVDDDQDSIYLYKLKMKNEKQRINN
ncbi:MAG: glycosyltransferase family 39 protein [Candidatus Omnitrophota bacterium]